MHVTNIMSDDRLIFPCQNVQVHSLRLFVKNRTTIHNQMIHVLPYNSDLAKKPLQAIQKPQLLTDIDIPAGFVLYMDNLVLYINYVCLMDILLLAWMQHRGLYNMLT